MRAHPYDKPTDREVSMWPGVTFERVHRGVHLGLVVHYGERTFTVIYTETPSDGWRGLKNHLAFLRRVLRRLGAHRSVSVRRAQHAPRRKREPTQPKRIRWPERPVVDPTRDPWAVLAPLRDRLERA